MHSLSKKKPEPPICPCCDEPTQLVTGDALYPERPDLRAKFFWTCFACDAYVGCHKNSKFPIGTAAQKPLRSLRSQVHAAFDPIWKLGKMSRSDAYAWLSAATKIPQKQCHIAMLDEDQCRKALVLIAGLRKAGSF